MPSNNRNSRDDKSKNFNRSAKPSSDSGERPRRSKSGQSTDSNNAGKKLFGGAEEKSFKGGFKRSDDRPRDSKSFGSNPERKFDKPGDRKYSKPDGGKFGSTDRKFSKPEGSSDRKFGKSEGSSDRKFGKSEGSTDRKFSRPEGSSKFGSGSGRKFDKDKSSDFRKSERPAAGRFGKSESSERPFAKKEFKSGAKRTEYPTDERKTYSEDRPRPASRSKQVESADDGLIRLNRYISNAGICSRRKADELIAAGVVSVNGVAVSELGTKVDPFKDVIKYNGETLKREKMVYVLLNKPKDYITTTEDPQERHTVMHLVEKASRERIYPVGRLDRNTTGLLLMTNDGDLTDKLSHPKNNVTKIYQVELNKSLSQGDLNKISFGIELEDGLIKPDTVTYVAGGSKKEVGIQIHSGKNRIVRRIFEHLGYEVVKLDRVVYANLTKKDLPRGRWRFLEEKEVIQLKHLIKTT